MHKSLKPESSLKSPSAVHPTTGACSILIIPLNFPQTQPQPHGTFETCRVVSQDKISYYYSPILCNIITGIMSFNKLCNIGKLRFGILIL